MNPPPASLEAAARAFIAAHDHLTAVTHGAKPAERDSVIEAMDARDVAIARLRTALASPSAPPPAPAPTAFSGAIDGR